MTRYERQSVKCLCKICQYRDGQMATCICNVAESREQKIEAGPVSNECPFSIFQQCIGIIKCNMFKRRNSI